MGSAHPTPRYTPVIRPSALTPSRPVLVIPLRPISPLMSPPMPAPRPQATTVPVTQRPWRVLLVSPMPGAATRGFDLARWQARLAAVVVVALVIVTAGGGVAVAAAYSSPDLFATSAELAILRGRLLAVDDSLAMARDVLAMTDDATGDRTVDAHETADNASSPTPAPRNAQRRARMFTSGSTSPTLNVPAIGELPVVGLIASGFSLARRHPLLHVTRPHLGVDVSAPTGTRIWAPAAGRVSFVGRRFAFGLVLEIEHGNGVKTRYAHLRRALVETGSTVVAGMPIATVGSSGLTTGPHLHYEVLVNGHQVDPLQYKMSGPNATTRPVGETPPSGTAAHEGTVVPLP